MRRSGRKWMAAAPSVKRPLGLTASRGLFSRSLRCAAATLNAQRAVQEGTRRVEAHGVRDSSDFAPRCDQASCGGCCAALGRQRCGARGTTRAAGAS